MKAPVAVLLAAGRGSRMCGLTDERPKCLLPLAGKPLLHWQLASLRSAGLKSILVVRGYHAELITGDFATVDNPAWASTNMVRTLLCALPAVPDQDLIVSYSDIVYKAEHVAALMHCREDIAILYDRAWRSLWTLRFNDPLSDAETFVEENGRLLEIGNTASSLDAIHGQYMGLLRFSSAGAARVKNLVEGLEPAVADKLDMTSLLRMLLNEGVAVHAVPVTGGWCECDTPEDIAAYEQAMGQGDWLHDWR